jgi:SAM-dependent methyltransferase
VCQFGVMFFPEKDKSYREIYRVLAPGGRYVFNVWGAHRYNHFGNHFGRGVPFRSSSFGQSAARPLRNVKWAAAALPSVIGGPVKDFNGVSGIGPAMAALLLGRRRGLAHRRWSELGEDRA